MVNDLLSGAGRIIRLAIASAALIAVCAAPGDAANLPKPLSDADAELYARIFALQEKGNWRAADREIKRLGDRLLMGHVLGQRYLHPTRYRSKFKELADWLKLYRDHPEARRIYRLAKRRKPRRAKAPLRPDLEGRQPIHQSTMRIGVYSRFRKAGIRTTRSTRRFHSRVRSLVRRTRLTRAEQYVQQAARQGRHAAHIDLARTRIAAGWFYHGDDKRALRLAQQAARRSGAIVPLADWYAGLAAFGAGIYDRAADHFEKLTTAADLSSSTRSAAAFWSARTNMIAGSPRNVSRYLQLAAKKDRTFYGILARKTLGLPAPYQWREPAGGANIAAVLQNPRARRALALVQAGQRHRGETEMRQLAQGSDDQARLSLLVAADALQMPGLAYRTALAIGGSHRPAVLRGLYPLPPWTPKGGFKLDKALVFAFMRQESAFNTRAKSHAGARGLMQLMPATAGFIANQRFRGRNRNKLFDPELNITLGHNYLDYLLQHQTVGNNLFLLAAAYNGGPGNLQKWKRKLGLDTDPLLLIESLPSRETRNFIERVLANLWVYRDRLGQPAPSLEALARGKLPLYQPVDKPSIAGAN